MMSRSVRVAARLALMLGLTGALPIALAQPAPAGAPSGAAPIAVVLNSADASVSLINTQTYKEFDRFTVGKEPHHLYPTADNRTLLVANAVSNDLSLLDPATGMRFWNEVLAVGGSRPALESFVAFRGRAPKIDALLRHNGMEQQAA